MSIFPSFFLGHIGDKNVFYDILERKSAFQGYKNKKSKKSENLHFAKGVNPWFWSKNGHAFSFFLCNIGQKIVVYDILERREAFLGHFCDIFLLGNIGQKNVFSHILEWKNAFLGYKYKKSKKMEKLTFFQRS